MPDQPKLERMREADLASGSKQQRVRRPAERSQVPIEIKVSMVALPCCRLSKVARWNGQAPQATTTPARAKRPIATTETATEESSRSRSPAGSARRR